jgi:competence protein ComEC
MNIIVSGVSHLPYSTLKGISISPFEAIILFLVILSTILFFSSRKKYYFMGGLTILILFMGMRAWEKTIHLHQQIITIYNIPGKSAVSFVSGEHSLMPFSNIDSNDVTWHIQYNRWKLGLKDNFSVHSDTNAILLSGKLLLQQQFIQFNSCRIAFIQQNTDLPSSANKLNLHCIIISGGYSLDMLNLENAFTFDTVIFDSSVPGYKLKNWEAECKQLNLRYYSVKEQGAYIENCYYSPPAPLSIIERGAMQSERKINC